MAKVALRTEFQGAKAAKLSSGELLVTVGFNYKGPAQTLAVEISAGKKGVWGDYDQESPIYPISKSVSAAETFESYLVRLNLPLSFWGDRKIDDGAVEVKIKGTGVSEEAVIWDAFTVNLLKGISFRVRGTGFENVYGEMVIWSCYYYDLGDWVGDGQYHGKDEEIAFANVKPGGHLFVYLMDINTESVSAPFQSKPFTAVNGGVYQYDLYTGEVSQIG